MLLEILPTQDLAYPSNYFLSHLLVDAAPLERQSFNHHFLVCNLRSFGFSAFVQVLGFILLYNFRSSPWFDNPARKLTPIT